MSSWTSPTRASVPRRRRSTRAPKRQPMTLTLEPRGPFSLGAAAAFAEGFPGTEADRPAGDLRFAWAIDDDWRTVTATVSQHGDEVNVELDGSPAAELGQRAGRDVARILSLDGDGDGDGDGFSAVGERDPVVGALQRRFPGLRLVLFFTP